MPSKKQLVSHASIVRAFAERLKGTRLARGMTQRQLADQANVTFSYISRLEAGGAAPGIDLLEKLAEALGVSTTDLLPPPDMPKDFDAHREQVRKSFEAVLASAGQETVTMLEVFLSRLAESPSMKR